MSEGGATRRAWIGAIVAAVVAVIVYARTWAGGGFGTVNYDDPYLLSPENPAIGKGLAEGMLVLLDPTRSPQFMHAWLPLYYGSLGLDHALFGPASEAARWYHLHSALLHACGAALVVFLAARLRLSAGAAALAGVLFAAHPAATENVAWIASRKDVLSFAWMALSALCWFRGIDGGGKRWHALGAALLAVSLTAKGTTLVLPLLLAAHALLLRTDGTARERLRPVVPYAAVAALMTGVHLWIARREETAVASGDSLLAVLGANGEVLFGYARLLVAPFLGQSVEWGISPQTADVSRALIGWIAFAACLGAAAAFRKSRPGIAATVACVLLALAPFNNVFPRTSVLFAERYAHVALLPFCIGFAGWLTSRPSPVRSAIAAGAVLAACVTTWLRLPVWADSVALWRDAARKAPASSIVRQQLADALTEAHRAKPAERALAEEAEAQWRDARRLAATDLDRYRGARGLGTHLLTVAPPGGNTVARVREAVTYFDEAERALATANVRASERPRESALLLTNRATARDLLEEREPALDDARKAVLADPKCVQALHVLARLYFLVGRAKEGIETLRLSAEAAPTDPSAALERARIRIAVGDRERAKKELEDAIAASPRNYDLLAEAAALDARLMRPIDAEGWWRRALDVRPGDSAATQGLATALLDQAQSLAARDDLAAAVAAAEKAREVIPDSWMPHQILGIVTRRAGDLEAAAVHLRKAHVMNRAGLRIREQLASVLVERAVKSLEDAAGTRADLILEEAVALDPAGISTPKGRLESGVSGWPPLDAGAEDVTRVARKAALRGLAWLAMRQVEEAVRELEVAAAGTKQETARRLRIVVLRLLVRARFLAGDADGAVAAAEELPALTRGETADAPPAWSGAADLAAARAERAAWRRGAGDVLGSEDDARAAEALLVRARDAGMPVSKFHNRRGELLFAMERFVEATRAFDEACAADPRDVEPLLNRAAVWKTHFRLEEDEQYLHGAAKDMAAALAVAPGDPRVLCGQGEVLALANKPSEAYPWLQRALVSDPSQSLARALLSRLTADAARKHLEKGDLADARTAANRAWALGEENASVYVLMGDVCRAERDVAEAEKWYVSAASRFPGDEEPRAALARHYMESAYAHVLGGRRADAAVAFHRALSVEQSKVDVSSATDRLHGIATSAFEEGVNHRLAGRNREAVAAFRLSVLAEPTKEGHLQCGIALDAIDDSAGAILAYDAALALAPDWTPARINRGAALLLSGRWDEARADYVRVSEVEPEGSADRAAALRQIAWIDAENAEIERERR